MRIKYHYHGSGLVYIPGASLMIRFLPVLLFGLVAMGCSTTANRKDGHDHPMMQRDLFAEKTNIDYARGFTLSYHGHYKVVRIFSPFEKHADTTTYLLVQRGSPIPSGYQDAAIINIPVRSLVAMSSMHIGLVSFLREEHILTGLGDLKYVSNPLVLDKIRKNEIVEVGKDQMLNEELLINMHPDLIMATGSPVSKINRYHGLKEAGVPVLVNSEWVETSPLARAEWVKLMAALLNKEGEVNLRFGAVEKEYKRLAGLTHLVQDRPEILCGINARDTWYVPNGDSYVHRFIQDAGGQYHWADTKATGSLPLNFEQVYPIGLKADCWINVGIGDLKSKAEVLAKDQRYADFKSFKTGNMYSFTRRVNSQGANDYWESGAVNPQEVLADLIRILHPELLPHHQLKYYKQIL